MSSAFRIAAAQYPIEAPRDWAQYAEKIARWVGEAGVTRDTVLAFGVIMLLCTLSFALLLTALLKANDEDAPIVKAGRRGRKGLITVLAYLFAIGSAFLWPYVAVAIYIAVALMWLVPDKRFERLVD